MSKGIEMENQKREEKKTEIRNNKLTIQYMNTNGNRIGI